MEQICQLMFTLYVEILFVFEKFEQDAFLFNEHKKTTGLFNQVPLIRSQNVPYLRHQTINHILCW